MVGPRSPECLQVRRKVAWQNPHHPPEPEEPFPSPRWVEEHSLLPHLHGDKVVQSMMESMGQTSQGSNLSSTSQA